MARTIVAFSTKGGVGKTLFSVNLAVALIQNNQKVCLIDLDVHGGNDMSRMLNLEPQKAMVDFMRHLNESPKTARKEDFIVHSKFGMDFLPAILRPQQSPHLDASKIKEVFGLLEKDYDFIIVDAGKSFSENFAAALNQANLILLVVTPDILSIYQTKWAIDTLQLLHLPLSMVKIILNRAESISGISWQEIKVSLPSDIIAHFPSEGKIVGLAVNRGVPVVIDNPKAKFSLAMRKFADTLIADSGLFLERKGLDQTKATEAGLEETGSLWRKEGMVEPLAEIDLGGKEDEILKLKRRIHSRLLEDLNLKRLDIKAFSDDSKKSKVLRDKAEISVVNLLAEISGSVISSSEARKKFVKEVLDEALGLGPLEDLLADPGINDIMVNNKDEIYIERNGKIELTDKKFISNEQVKAVIERIIAPIGRHIDESIPMVDARLADGSRVNALIPPLALSGPTITIRKFRKERLRIEELIELKSLDTRMADFLKACVISRKNMIVSGGTGSGKTTILNVLSSFIPENERIITIEDAAELKLDQRHWIRLESRPMNIEGKGAITIRDLFKNTLRMRPDRIIIGECRGLEALDMLQAMNTGHDGSLTTIHANSTADVLSRLDSMILMSGIELPIRAIREMVASAVDLIVHTNRLSDGTRKIVQITELAGLKNETQIDTHDIFVFNQAGIDTHGHVLGEFQSTGYVPGFFEEMKIRGIPLSESIFKKK